ncbi:hypothetical protein DVR12_16195 [Chitinophaga silvatica]|uniref:Uncharacterized protein n=1 Tax=Chitinophaga silvatica TaxID=2282649 RepID=A0A3E1Y8E3_9BACT|nr:hypothetical protein [Chitinophaga silvatica]RFS21436.1 hypothetical protein DVR12_16195 [Chitinophaga silvatica]
MLPNREEFLTNYVNEGIAICGKYLGADAVHVGLYWNSEGEKKIVHFLNGNNIPIDNVEDPHFEQYLFCTISDFPSYLVASISALCELINQNRINGFEFERIGVSYDGGKFSFVDGSYTGKTGPEKFVNCGVFILALLNTYDYPLIDWENWPNVDLANLNFLTNWLNMNGIPQNQRQAYYNKTKAIRGKHILVSPLTLTKPSTFEETQKLSEDLIAQLSNPPLANIR